MWLFLGTTFYTSLLFKKAPGTISSLAVFLLLYFANPISLTIKFLLFVLVIFLHVFSFPSFEKKYENDDPSLYTLDETLAIIALNFVISTPMEWCISFFLFRFFDIIKPLGIKRIEKLRGTPSIIRNAGDDLVAALYTYLLIIGYRYAI
jgi:phosphatidylglycerophosphatase A